MTSIIARATTDDARLLVDMGQATYRAHFADIWSPTGLEAYVSAQFNLARLSDELAGDRVRYYLARSDGAALGFVKLVLDRTPLLREKLEAVELEKIYLTPEQTGRGVGSALIGHALADVAGKRWTHVWLDCLQTNLRARRLYEREGFAVIGELPFATDLREIGFWVMARALTR